MQILIDHLLYYNPIKLGIISNNKQADAYTLVIELVNVSPTPR